MSRCEKENPVGSPLEKTQLPGLRRRGRYDIDRLFTLVKPLPCCTAAGLAPLQRIDNRDAVQVRQRLDAPRSRAMICARLQRVMPDDFTIDAMQDKVADGHQGAGSVNILAAAKVSRVQCVKCYQAASAAAGGV